MLRYPQSGFSRASRRIRALMSRRVAGRPVLARADLAAQRRRTMSRCQRTTVSGVTSSRSPWRRALGITAGKAASRARSARQAPPGRHPGLHPTFAKFNRIRIDEDGEPDRHDLELAWLGGARAIRLTPR